MRYKFSYENNRGQIINLSEHPYYLDIEPMFDYQWSYSQKEKRRGNIIAGFAKDIKDVDLTLHIMAKTIEKRDEAIDNFNNLIEADIYDGIAGKIWCGDWYTRGYIVAAKNNKWQYGNPIIKKGIKLVREQENWWHVIRAANFGERDESAVSVEEDYIKTYESSGVDSGIKSLVANIVPKQSGSGTPSPDNIRPISGWESVETSVCGKNLVDIADGSITTTITLLSKELTAGTYTFSSFGKREDGGQWRVLVTTMDGTEIEAGTASSGTTMQRNYATFTLAETTSIRLQLQFLSSYSTLHYENVQLEVGSTATEYTPYITPTTHTTDLGRTVYGGTVDVVRGTLTVDRAMITLDGSHPIRWEDWRHQDNGTSAWLYSIELFPMAESNDIFADKLPTVAYADIFGGDVGISRVSQNATYSFGVRVAVDGLTTVTAINAWLSQNPITVVYPLAEPQTYTLTPQQINTLSGVNNVWADSGDVTVTFRDDNGNIQTENGSIVTFEKKNALSGSGYDYAYDYMRDVQNQKRIVNPSSLPCDFVVNIQGYVDRPEIQIGQNVISVDVEVPYGAVLMIDSSNKTAVMRLANGELVNVFGARNPDYYLFEKIKSGKNIVSWNGSYLWEINMLEERSEPRWLMD